MRKTVAFPFLILVFLFMGSVRLFAQQKQNNTLGDIILYKYSFVVFGLTDSKDVETLENFLLQKEGIIYAKSDFPENTFTVVCVEQIDDSKIAQLCAKLHNKTDKFSIEKLKADEYLAKYQFQSGKYPAQVHSGNKELDKYIMEFIHNQAEGKCPENK
ncbi:MAG: hypothetical protein HY958_03775 [Bacteroidia bacterium]|nr:hypothetical protein [Bacteroidia bacterium]